MKTTKKQIRDIIKEEIQNVLSEGSMKTLESDIVNGLIEMMQSLNIELEMIKDVIDSGAVQDAQSMLDDEAPGKPRDAAHDEHYEDPKYDDVPVYLRRGLSTRDNY
tara:strand:- start:435 stop:752 length:318 start_codon:yes stop_codon:yes gene_type:complete